MRTHLFIFENENRVLLNTGIIINLSRLEDGFHFIFTFHLLCPCGISGQKDCMNILLLSLSSV